MCGCPGTGSTSGPHGIVRSIRRTALPLDQEPTVLESNRTHGEANCLHFGVEEVAGSSPVGSTKSVKGLRARSTQYSFPSARYGLRDIDSSGKVVQSASTASFRERRSKG